MPVQPIDTLLAIKGLLHAPGLLETDRLVGFVLIESYNRRTGQCDPGVERISKLVGISTRTVIRSTRRLEAAGLFKKARHGGHFNRNRYEPVWARFAELEAAWQKRLKSQWKANPASPAGSHASHATGDSGVTQTCASNLLKTTYTDSRPRTRTHSGNRSTGSQQAAETAAERRWTNALHHRFATDTELYGRVIAAIDRDIRSRATAAEMGRRGGGINYLIEQLRLAGITRDEPPFV